MISFTAEEKTVQVWPSSVPDMPVICLHTFSDEGSSVYEALRVSECPEFNLIAVSNLDWNRDMSPWKALPVLKNGDDFGGGADSYLSLFLSRILPEAEKEILGYPVWRGIAGYSMAGLFALYTLFQTNIFSRCASVSGSLWFPGIKEYVFLHEMKEKPQKMYFSVGDRECRTGNPVMKTVQKNTEEIASFFRTQGIDTKFQLNQGNHFKDSVRRTAAGIAWMLSA